MSSLAADLSFFAVVARASSLTAAARELDLSVAAVSKRLSALERDLGAELLSRNSRALSLTEAGERLLRGANELLGSMEQLREDILNPKAPPRGRLRINGTYGFGRRFLAPIIDAYVRQYPQVDVQLLLTDYPLNLNARAVDLCLWLDALPEQRQVARTICASRRLVVASPHYLQNRGVPQSPADLSQHACLLLRQTDQTYATWRFTRGRTSESVRVRGPLASNDGEVVKLWCLAGHGVMLRSEWDVADQIRDGSLVPLLNDYTAPNSDLVAWFLPGQQRAGKVKSFLDFLADSIGKNPPWRLSSQELHSSPPH
jgi:LysR family transcriptional regulator, transcriptional activator for dmlA